MKNQAYRMTMLFDFYGDLLTDRQKEFYDLYYNEDLSLSEIAENYGITRQGVRDIIMRAENTLTEFEEKTGLIRRFHEHQMVFQQIDDMLEEINILNQTQLRSKPLAQYCSQIHETVAALRRE